MNKKKNLKKSINLIESGAEIAGSAVGGAIGFLAGGPVGAAGAAALGTTLGRAISDFANRHLSRKEEIRVGACAAIAINNIKLQIDSGLDLRDDDFFNLDNNGNSIAEEIFEGVLLKSKNEHEEKKVEHLGIYFAKLAFSPGVTQAEANHLLNIAENLTYRQMCVLSILKANNDEEKFVLRDTNYRNLESPIPFETVSLLQEIIELQNVGLVARTIKNRKNEGFFYMQGWSDIVPNLLGLRPLGFRITTLLGVDQISNQEIDPIIDQLSSSLLSINE